MRNLRWQLIAAAAAIAIVAAVALGAGGKGYSGSATYKVTNAGKSDPKTGFRTGVGGKGAFSGNLAAGRRSLLAAYAAAASIPLRDVLKGGRYAVRWSTVKGKIHATVLAKFKAVGAGSVCIAYTSTQTT